MCFIIKSHTWEHWEEIENTRKKQNDKDDRKRKNKEKIASIDFNSTNLYIEVEVFTINAIWNLHMDNHKIDSKKSPLYHFLVSFHH